MAAQGKITASAGPNPILSMAALDPSPLLTHKYLLGDPEYARNPSETCGLAKPELFITQEQGWLALKPSLPVLAGLHERLGGCPKGTLIQEDHIGIKEE